MMYSCNQRGVCSVALLTLLGRKLSRACVYLSLFVLRSPRPCRENTRRRRRYGESHGAAQTNSFDPRYNQASVSRNTRSGQRVAAHVALLHSVTCEQPQRGPEVPSVQIGMTSPAFANVSETFSQGGPYCHIDQYNTSAMSCQNSICT